MRVCVDSVKCLRLHISHDATMPVQIYDGCLERGLSLALWEQPAFKSIFGAQLFEKLEGALAVVVV